jgi:hypothetical protein
MDGNISKWQDYVGKYECLRLGNDDRFVTGEITIDVAPDGTHLHHYHNSEQFFYDSSKTPKVENFDHRGPIFFTGNRLYFFACGLEDGTRYFRPMIFEGSDLPHHNIMYGVVLTETPRRFQPMASAVALVSTAHPKSGDPELLDEIENALKQAIQTDKVLKGILVT